MIAAVIAIAGTLAGALLSGLLSGRQADPHRVTRLRTAARRQDAVDAVAAHRAAMWYRETLRLTGEDWTEARRHSHTTRAAISAPAVRLAVLAPPSAPPWTPQPAPPTPCAAPTAPAL